MIRAQHAVLAALALALPLGALVPPRPALAADDGTALAALLEQKAPSVVSVKFVLKMRMSMGGQTQDQEENAEVRGVVVDPSGLVMLANDSLEGSVGMLRSMFRRRGAQGMDVSATPSDLKVLFGNESTEHDAVLVARDSNLGLAFVQILASDVKVPAAVDLTKGSEPRVGQLLMGVTRKGRGFDCAAVLERVFVAGKVEKPRPLWAVSGGGAVGLPVYDLEGRPAGVLAHQQGVEGAEEGGGLGGRMGLGGDGGAFVLPLESVLRALDQAKKRVPEAVAKAKEAAKEKEAPKEGEAGMGEPAMGDGGMGDAGMTEPGMGEAPTTPDQPK